MNLYIIGNGFDKTSYYNFKSYLIDHGEEICSNEGYSISKKRNLTYI